MEGGRPRTRWIEMRGKNWEEIQENRKWKNRDGWRFPCNSEPISLGMMMVERKMLI